MLAPKLLQNITMASYTIYQMLPFPITSNNSYF